MIHVADLVAGDPRAWFALDVALLALAGVVLVVAAAAIWWRLVKGIR